MKRSYEYWYSTLERSAPSRAMELDLEELLAIADDLEKADQSSARKDDSASGGRGSNDASAAPSDGDAGEFNSQEVELLSLVGSALSDVMSSELSDTDGRLSDEEHPENVYTTRSSRPSR